MSDNSTPPPSAFSETGRIPGPVVTAYLNVVTGDVDIELRTIELIGPHMSLGRAASNDITLKGLQISRKHCIFKYDNSKWGIRDFSTNGIMINTSHVSKVKFSKLSEGDLLHLIPGGILTFRFHQGTPVIVARNAYTPTGVLGQYEMAGLPRSLATFERPPLLGLQYNNNASEERVFGTPVVPPPARSHTQTRAEEEESPSSANEAFLSAMNAWDTSMSSVEEEPNSRSTATRRPVSSATTTVDDRQQMPEASCKRTFDLMKEYEKKSKKRIAATRNRKRLKGFSSMIANIGGDFSDSSDLEMEFVPEFHGIGNRALNKPRIETTTRDTSEENAPATDDSTHAINNLVEVPAPPMVRSASPLPIMDVDSETDLTRLRNQIKHLMTKFQTAELESKRISLRFKMEKEELSSQLVAANIQANDQRESLHKSLLQALDELNCCICNEVFMQATVIDCGHTFCFFCITEWSNKKHECPICRTKMLHRTKHVEMENFIVMFFKLMSPEVQAKRCQLLNERVEEEAKAKAEARAAQLRAASARANPRARMDGLPDRFVNLLVQLQELNNTFGEPNAQAGGGVPPTPGPGRGGRNRASRYAFLNPLPFTRAGPVPPPAGHPLDHQHGPQLGAQLPRGGGRGQEQQVPNFSELFTRRPLATLPPPVIDLSDSQEIVPDPVQPQPPMGPMELPDSPFNNSRLQSNVRRYLAARARGLGGNGN